MGEGQPARPGSSSTIRRTRITGSGRGMRARGQLWRVLQRQGLQDKRVGARPLKGQAGPIAAHLVVHRRVRTPARISPPPVGPAITDTSRAPNLDGQVTGRGQPFVNYRHNLSAMLRWGHCQQTALKRGPITQLRPAQSDCSQFMLRLSHRLSTSTEATMTQGNPIESTPYCCDTSWTRFQYPEDIACVSCEPAGNAPRSRD